LFIRFPSNYVSEPELKIDPIDSPTNSPLNSSPNLTSSSRKGSNGDLNWPINKSMEDLSISHEPDSGYLSADLSSSASSLYSVDFAHGIAHRMVQSQGGSTDKVKNNIFTL